MQGDRPLNIPMQDLIVYEAHVRGFTADPSSGVDAPGTYSGMAERLDYLQVSPPPPPMLPAPHAPPPIALSGLIGRSASCVGRILDARSPCV